MAYHKEKSKLFMGKSKWSKHDDLIASYWNEVDSPTYWGCARSIIGENTSKRDLDLFRTYIKRKVRTITKKKNEVNKFESVVDETLHSNTPANDYVESAPKILTALDDAHRMMDIDKYCEYYNLPREDISSYKLVTHTGTPFYNIVFREKTEVGGIDFVEAISEAVGGISSFPLDHTPRTPDSNVTRLIYTDTHIAMCTDDEGTAMYATAWDKDELFVTLNYMCARVLDNKVGDVLYIDDLGDVLDGWDGKTTRGGHDLPQNMSSQEAFKVALEFKLSMIATLRPHFSHIVCHNVCVDNHSGRFSMVLNHAFKEVVSAKFSNVEVVNYEKFMAHYFIGIHAFVLCHGKDHKSLRFGFKPNLDAAQAEKIDHYLKHNQQGSIFKEADEIWFDKGDSHQMLFDYSSAQDFNYMNYPALSPASEWVQTGFKKGIRGFVIQQIDPRDKNIRPIPIII